MNTLLLPCLRLKPTRRETGVALVITLSMIVLIAGVVIAFMASVRSDVQRLNEYQSGKDAAAFSETATSLVMAQIREATLSGIQSDGRGTHAWASQPGALRVWDSQGSLHQLYKLYSSSRMKEENMNFLLNEIPTDWQARPNEYTNLNEPVATGKGASQIWHYPTFSPEALDQIPGYASTQTVTTPEKLIGDARVVMPVRWLYISKDGTLTEALTDNSVGRVAFWTDDETCKVNINTAAASASQPSVSAFPPASNTSGSTSALGFSYWNVPRTQLLQDWNLARGAPDEGEYQRYPGHPATVNLGTILGRQGLSNTDQKTELVSFYDLLPAYRWGGSENNRIPWTQAASRTRLTGSGQSTDRLYASVDELRFRPTLSGTERALNAFPDYSGGVEARLAASRFLLTAHSRAPDLNLFGQPRVTLWPLRDLNAITDESLYRTPQEKLIAFASTYAPHSSQHRKEYFFARRNPMSQTEDWTAIPRNQAVYAYLQEMTQRSIPGFGGNFLAKYEQNGGAAGERDQILTAIFDWIRCVNLNEASTGVPAGFQSYTPRIDVPASAVGGFTDYSNWLLANQTTYRGAGVVLPISINHGSHTTRGAGRVPTLSEVALLMTQRQNNPGSASPTPSQQAETSILVETFSPMHGFMPWAPNNFSLRIESDATLEGLPLFPNATSGVNLSPINRSVAGVSDDTANQPIGGTDGFTWMIANNLATSPFSRSQVQSNAVPIPVPLPGNTPSLRLGAGSMTIDFSMGGVDYQTFELDLPATNFKAPTDQAIAFNARKLTKGVRIFPQDVIHSVVPKDGDYRIIAYLPSVPKEFFRPHPDWGSTASFAHSLRLRKLRGVTGSNETDGTSNGSFVSGLNYTSVVDPNEAINSVHQFWTNRPDIPPDITDLIAEGWMGDWSNGIGDFPAGAYLGKADDGMRSAGNNALYYGEFNWYSGAGFFSPSQQVPSAVMLGSLPTGVKRTLAAYTSGNDAAAAPWRTLLFCKNPAIGNAHFGALAPHDSLLLDLFTMPVVEPYAISEPTSTAGRINMNYQIFPFTGIQRASALHALFSFPVLPAFPDNLSAILQGHPTLSIVATIQSNASRIYHKIDAQETLQQFDQRFSTGDIFRSATEICSLWLVPEGVTLSNTPAWWNSHRATGDNLRERPYGEIYPLLTTKSNTYTVHIRAQSLSIGTHTVTGEYRGSAMIERYIDPMDERLTNGEIDPDQASLEPLYRFRVIETKRFAP